MPHFISRLLGLVALAISAVAPVGATDIGIQRGGVEQMHGLGFDPDSSEARYLQMSPDERKAAFSREVKEIRIAEQFGLGYLPLMVMRQQALIEKYARLAYLGYLDVTWVRYPSGDTMNNALRFGLLDLASGGVPPLLKVWDETRGDFGVKGIAPLAAVPMYLNVNKPKLKSLKDLGKKDVIAVPSKGISSQAVILQMAAARLYGRRAYEHFDPLMVTMSHPDAMKALLAGSVSGHFASPPYQYQELKAPGVHTLLNSYEVLGGPATMTVLWASGVFCDTNPKTCQAVVDALKEAMDFIAKEPRGAATVYVVHTHSGLSVDQVEEMIRRPEIRYSLTPLRILDYANFMHQTGRLRNLPRSWREIFMPRLDVEGGS